MNWDDVVQTASELPEVTVSTSYGTPALKVRGKLLARFRPEDDSLVLLGVPPDERDMLIAADPGVFHVTPHYDGYPIVLGRMQALDAQQLLGLLRRRWREIAPKRVVVSWEASRETGGHAPPRGRRSP